MQVLHDTVLPSSSIHHALHLPHFTPSTIYPIPQPTSQFSGGSGLDFQVKVVGNVVVAGGDDLRVFEVREELVPLGGDRKERANGKGKERMKDEDEEMDEMMEEDKDGFKSMGEIIINSQTTPRTRFKLHLLQKHTLQGTVTGLAAIRTMSSVTDGLDRLIVSMKDAKMAILEWSRGEVATVSLHTFERCPQVMMGDLEAYRPLLRSDPLSRLAALLLPEDGLAMLPIVQDLSDIEGLGEGSAREVPYTPSFVIPATDISPSIISIKDFIFLTGFNNPTICVLFSPRPTTTGHYSTVRDTYQLEIRTLDVHSKTYAGLTRVDRLPSDALYLVPCGKKIGGVLVVTETAVIHVDQAGKLVILSLNGWSTLVSALSPVDRSSESAKLELDGSRIVWISEDDFLVFLKSGEVRQVAVEMDGRSVTRLVLREEGCGMMCLPSAVVRVGVDGVFVGCAGGDSVVAKVAMRVLETATNGDNGAAESYRMDIELDEDLYGDSAAMDDGPANKADEKLGPLQASLEICDTLNGIGYIADMVFGAAEVDEEVVPELVAVGGGAGPSTFNVFRQGVPARKWRTLDEIEEAQGVWSMAIDSSDRQRLGSKTDTVLVSTDLAATNIFRISSDGGLFHLRSLEGKTHTAAPFFSDSAFVCVSSHSITTFDGDGNAIQAIAIPETESSIAGASVSAPFVVVRKEDGSVGLFKGDLSTRQLEEVTMPTTEKPSKYAAATLFSDLSGIFRTFEATSDSSMAPTTRTADARAIQELTSDHLEQLQALKPSMSTVLSEGMEFALDQARGTQWLILLQEAGRMDILSLPDLAVVFSAEGLLDGAGALVDKAELDASPDNREEEEEIDCLVVAAVGSGNPRPHLIATYKSGKLLAYEAQPRFTLESSSQHQRRSLAVRFNKVLTRTIARAKLSRTLVPFSNLAGYCGVLLTGSAPFWLLASDAHPIHAVAALDPVHAFGSVDLPGSQQAFFMHTAKGPNVFEVDPDLCLDFTLSCRRIRMERSYTNVVYDPLSRLYVGAATMTVPYQIYSDECVLIEDRSEPNLTPSTMERSTVELFSPHSWQPLDGYDFEENEVVLCMQVMPLECPGDESGFRHMLVVGTSVNRSEDLVTKGNTYVFEISELVPSSPGEATHHKLRLLVKENAVAPVSAIGNVSGYLVQAMGQKVYIKALDLEERLVPVAFMDVGVYVTSIGVMKSLILLGDLVKSVWFCAFQESPFKFELLGRDYQDNSVVTCDFMAAEGKIGFVTTDVKGDLRLMEYDAAHPNSLNGERLLRKTEYHAGSAMTKSLPIARRKGADEMPQVQLLYSNENGAISTLTPSKAARAKRLLLLTNLLYRMLPPVAGLNPKAHRTIHNSLYARPLAKGVFDGELLRGFVGLGKGRQEEIVEPLGSGTGRETILNDIEDLSGFW